MTTYEILKNAQFLISKQKNHICQIFQNFPKEKFPYLTLKNVMVRLAKQI